MSLVSGLAKSAVVVELSAEVVVEVAVTTVLVADSVEVVSIVVAVVVIVLDEIAVDEIVVVVVVSVEDVSVTEVEDSVVARKLVVDLEVVATAAVVVTTSVVVVTAPAVVLAGPDEAAVAGAGADWSQLVPYQTSRKASAVMRQVPVPARAASHTSESEFDSLTA